MLKAYTQDYIDIEVDALNRNSKGIINDIDK